MILKVFSHIEQPLQEVENYLDEVFSHSQFEKISSKYTKGKRLRPGLLLFTSRGYEVAPPKLIRIASAIELAHFASLIHDDVVDNARMRRGIPSLNETLGDRRAVIIGDYIFSIGIDWVADTNPQIFKVLSSSVRRMCEGELMEESIPREALFNKETYYSLIDQKTASLFYAASTMGALFYGSKNLEPYSTYGHNLGMIYQILDDCADLLDERNEDLLEGKVTLPVLLVKDRILKDFPDFVYDIKGADLGEVRDIVLESDGILQAKQKTEPFFSKSLRALEEMPEPLNRYLREYLEELVELGERIFVT